MKKIIGIVLISVMAMLCVACGSKEETAICTVVLEESGIEHKMTLDAKGDIVHTMTQVTTVDLSYYTDSHVTALKSSLEQYKEVYDSIKGVKYKAEVKGNNIYERITIDLTKEKTIKALREKELLPIDGSSDKISLKKTVSNLKDQGWHVEVVKK